MQQNYVDAADRFKSLDDIWYFGGQDEHRQVAAMDHLPQNRDEIEIRIGKLLSSANWLLVYLTLFFWFLNVTNSKSS